MATKRTKRRPIPRRGQPIAPKDQGLRSLYPAWYTLLDTILYLRALHNNRDIDLAAAMQCSESRVRSLYKHPWKLTGADVAGLEGLWGVSLVAVTAPENASLPRRVMG